MFHAKSKVTSRLTVVGRVYHQETGGQPVDLPVGFARKLTSGEQPYGPRRVTVGAEWMPLDRGWLKSVGMVCAVNLEGTNPQVIPTPEEKQALEDRVLELGMAFCTDEKDWVVRFASVGPGESQTLSIAPEDYPHLRVRCPAGECRMNYLLLPS